MEHQTRDSFWRHGSVCEDYGQITIPVLNVSGRADGHAAAGFRSVKNSACTKGTAGPWGHCFPFSGLPGPAIGFLQEALRRWERWLKGIDTGGKQDPALRLFVQDCAPPAVHHATRTGRWVAACSPGHRVEFRSGSIIFRARRLPARPHRASI
jgi:predicted acyl esterase